jgi:hypothetical protein
VRQESDERECTREEKRQDVVRRGDGKPAFDGGETTRPTDDGEQHRHEAATETSDVDLLRAGPAPRSEAVVAVVTWGRNRIPYCVFDRSYSSGSVKIVLAAGNVTSTIPWTASAA